MEIASPFVSPVVEIMINKMISYIEGQINRRKDFEDGLEELNMRLLTIKEVVDSTEMEKLTSVQKQILSKLKEVLYEADDFLDELDYDYLEKEAKKQTEKADSSSILSDKANFYVLEKILKKLELVDRLPRGILPVIGKSLVEATKDVNPAVGIPNHRLTSSYIKEKKIFGRDDQKEDLVRILTESSDEPKEGDKKSIDVVALFGQGGIGKTTLAQHVYNDERIKDRFDLKIWVCVSTSSDKVRITKEILEGASGTPETHKDIINFDMLVKRLKENLKSKRFLLVLDDIWYEKEFDNEDHWRELLAPLREVGESSSKIMVTTREIRTAETLEATDLIELKGLSDDDCWSLLRSCAFRDQNSTDRPELEDIGEKIAERLKGSPLAARVVGGMLRFKLEVSYWKDILQKQVFDNIIKTLKLSYDSLPKHLKPCFSICAVFPKDWRFDPDDLVALWLAQGYVQTQDDEATGMIAKRNGCFEDLVSRSFFQPTEDDNSPRYVMHDLIHDLAQDVSGGECLLLEGTELKKTPYHLGVLQSILTDDNLVMQQLKKSCILQNLRTFIYFGGSSYSESTLDDDWEFIPEVPRPFNYLVSKTPTPTDVFNELKDVRAVVIYGPEFSSTEVEDLLKSLANKKHLRYLYFYGEWLSIPPLYHLQTVDMYKGRERMLSKGLAHLKEFGNLIVCRGDFVFDVEREFRQRDSFVVCELKKFVDVLHGSLEIQNLQNLCNKEEALELGIGRGQYIIKLTLQWNLPEYSMSNSHIFEDVIDGLHPHPNLRDLYIKNYGGARLPSWLEKNQFDDEKNVSIQFPMLKHLRFENMPKLSMLNGENWDKLFPYLESLTIIECPNLMDVTLQKLLLLPKLILLRIKNAINCPSFTLVIRKKTKNMWSIRIGSTRSPYGEKLAGQDLSILSFLQRLIFVDYESIPNLRFRRGAENSDQKSNWIESPSFVLEFLRCRSEDAWFWRCLEGLPSLKELIINVFMFFTSDVAGLGERDYCNRNPCAELDSLEIIDCNISDRSLSECLLNVANVSKMGLYYCDNLTSLPPAEVLHRFTALRELTIRRCDRLISLGGLNALVNLQEMIIDICPNLDSLPDEGLPASLKSLKIYECNLTDRSLSKCLLNVANVLKLELIGCNNLTSLPPAEVLHRFTALRKLEIRCCDQLVSLGGLNALVNLQEMYIGSCPKLDPLPDKGLPASLRSLKISDCNLTDRSLSECLLNVANVSKLELIKCDNLTSLPPAEVLHRLTALRKLNIINCNRLISLGGLNALVNLQEMYIHDSPKLESLPDEGLPASVKSLTITFCHPQLMQQVEGKTGPQWNKISHIPSIEYYYWKTEL